jgi:hypothetical protein
MLAVHWEKKGVASKYTGRVSLILHENTMGVLETNHLAVADEKGVLEGRISDSSKDGVDVLQRRWRCIGAISGGSLGGHCKVEAGRRVCHGGALYSVQ